MAKTERERLEIIQDAMAVIKGELKWMQKSNTTAGRLEAANACMLFGGKVTVLHGEMMGELRRLWPEAVADGIQTRGGGDR